MSWRVKYNSNTFELRGRKQNAVALEGGEKLFHLKIWSCTPRIFQETTWFVHPWRDRKKVNGEVMFNHRGESGVVTKITTTCWLGNAQGDPETWLSGPEFIADSNDGAEKHALALSTPSKFLIEKIGPPRNRPRKGGECSQCKSSSRQ